MYKYFRSRVYIRSPSAFLTVPKLSGGDRIGFPIIILAAGLSERMGVFKPLLPVGGQPAVIRCIRAAEAAGINDIYIVTGHKHAETESVLRGKAPGARVVYNRGYRDGMFSSALAGISALPDSTDGFFLLPADCCAVSADVLRALIERFVESKGACVARPVYRGRRGHPPLIPARFIGALLSYNGENGLKGFLSPLPTIEVEMSSPGVLMDMDTPEDYAGLLSFLGLPTYPTSEICKELLNKHCASAEIAEHGEQVAALALKIAKLMEARGIRLDIKLLESACLLHDISRLEPDHARAGKELLLREGYPKTAVLVGCHMDMPSFNPAIGEAELLFLADKLSRRGKITSLEDTMRGIESRFACDPEALASAKERINTAQAIMDTLKARYGIGNSAF